MKTCTKCGKQYEDNMEFCTGCGEKLETIQTETVKSENQPKNENAIMQFITKNWPIVGAVFGYVLSWVDGFTIIGTVIALSGLLGWIKDKGKYCYENTALRVIATGISIWSIIELFMYGVFN